MIGRLAGVLFLLIWIIVVSINTHLHKELFSAVIYACFAINTIFWILKIFDKAPVMVIDDKGIWSRKTILPFSKMYLISWNDIYFFYIRQKMGNNNRFVARESLIIGRKDGKPDSTINNCLLFKSSMQAILTEINKYAEVYQFHQLGTIQKSQFYITLSL